MVKLIVFAVSVFLISILGFITIRTTSGSDKEIYNGYISLALVLLVDVIIVGFGFYFYLT